MCECVIYFFVLPTYLATGSPEAAKIVLPCRSEHRNQAWDELLLSRDVTCALIDGLISNSRFLQEAITDSNRACNRPVAVRPGVRKS